jgi:hypothetical protein
MSDESLPPDFSILGDDDTEFFRTVHGRILNTLNPRYMLPADEEEIKVWGFPHIVSFPIRLFMLDVL